MTTTSTSNDKPTLETPKVLKGVETEYVREKKNGPKSGPEKIDHEDFFRIDIHRKQNDDSSNLARKIRERFFEASFGLIFFSHGILYSTEPLSTTVRSIPRRCDDRQPIHPQDA